MKQQMRFSQRIGAVPVKHTIQTDSMDQDLRNGIWNILTLLCWNKLDDYVDTHWTKGDVFSRFLWRDFYKWPIDSMPRANYERAEAIRSLFFKSEWHGVYDLLEFSYRFFPFEYGDKERFVASCNAMLERELSGYRLAGEFLTPITSEQELASIEAALQTPDRFRPTRIHLEGALSLMSDRKSPDYRNSIKESISAVESACKIITGKQKATLDEALAELARKKVIHPALRKALGSLYGYTSDAHGIRHALLDESTLGFDDAKFMLVCCSAFINFVVATDAR